MVCAQNAVVTIYERLEANFALGTLALPRKLKALNLAFVELRVLNLEQAVALRAVLGLNTLTIFLIKSLVSYIFMPWAEVPIDFKVRLKLRLFTESEAKLALDRLYECKGCHSN